MTDKPEAETKHANPYTLSPSEVGERLGAKHVALQEAMGRAAGSGAVFNIRDIAGFERIPDANVHVHTFEPVATPVQENAKARETERMGEADLAAHGQAQYVGLDAFLPRQRVFTREEVLTVLRTLKATTGVAAGKEALDVALRAFEGME